MIEKIKTYFVKLKELLIQLKKDYLHTIYWIAILYGCGVTVDRYLENRIVKITKLDGIELNEKISDTLFKNGLSKVEIKKFNDKGYETYGDLDKSNSGEIGVVVKEKKIKMIYYICSKDSYDIKEVSKIRCGMNGESIQKRFKEDLIVTCSKSDVSVRSYKIKEYGLNYILRSNKVEAFTITDGERLFVDDSEDAYVDCD